MKILGHEYKIEFNEHLSQEAGANGQCCSNRLKIILDPTLPESRTEEALLHEIFEALKFHLNLLDLSHETLSQLAECLYQVFVDNPHCFNITVLNP